MFESHPMEAAVARKMKPDITVGKQGKYSVRDRGTKNANLLAIIRKARKLGYSDKVIQKRWGKAVPGFHAGDDVMRQELKKSPTYHKGDDIRRGA